MGFWKSGTGLILFSGGSGPGGGRGRGPRPRTRFTDGEVWRVKVIYRRRGLNHVKIGRRIWKITWQFTPGPGPWLAGGHALPERFAGNGDGQGVDRESIDDEGSENDFRKHDDGGCRKKEQITTAPGLKL